MQSYSKSELAISALLRAKECFLSADLISSTILAGTAHQVLRDLCIARGLATSIDQVSSSLGHPTRNVHDLVSSSYNGMKHADRNPDDFVSISSAEPQALFVLSAADLARLNIPYSDAIGAILNCAKSFKSEQST